MRLFKNIFKRLHIILVMKITYRGFISNTLHKISAVMICMGDTGGNHRPLGLEKTNFRRSSVVEFPPRDIQHFHPHTNKLSIWLVAVRTPEYSFIQTAGHVTLAGIIMTDDTSVISQTAHGTSSSTATFLYVYWYSAPYIKLDINLLSL